MKHLLTILIFMVSLSLFATDAAILFNSGRNERMNNISFKDNCILGKVRKSNKRVKITNIKKITFIHSKDLEGFEVQRNENVR